MRVRLATRHRTVIIKTATELNAFEAVKTLAQGLHFIDPQVRVLEYVGGLAAPDSHHPHYGALDDDDLLYAGVNRVQPLSWSPLHEGDRQVKVINYAREATRNKLISWWQAFLVLHDLDGVLFDTFHPLYMASWMSNPPAVPNGNGGWGLPAGGYDADGTPQAFHTESWWFSALSTFTGHLRWELAGDGNEGSDGKEVWVNGLYDYAGFNPANPNHAAVGRGFSNISNYATGALSEALHEVWATDGLRRYVDVAAIVNTKRARTLWSVQTALLGIVGDSAEIRRYFLAVYLLLQLPGLTMFSYNPGPVYQAYRVVNGQPEPWLFDGGADWDHEYGVATSWVEWFGDVARRTYTTGFAAVNPTDQSCPLPLRNGTYRSWDPANGDVTTVTAGSMNLPAKTGMFFWRVG